MGGHQYFEYDFSSISHFLNDIQAGEHITFKSHASSNLFTITRAPRAAGGDRMWFASWDDDDDEPSPQPFLCSELIRHFFGGEVSLWATEDLKLLRASEYLALPLPRPKAWSISLLNGAATAESPPQSEVDGSEAAESEAGESKAGESEGGESIDNFPSPCVEVQLRKGRSTDGGKLEGTFHGRVGDKLGVWDAYLRFNAAKDCSEGTDFLWRGDIVATPTVARAVLLRLMGATKVGGRRATVKEENCYACLLYNISTSKLFYATMPNVTPVVPAETADAALMAKMESMLCDFRAPTTVSAVISAASRASPSQKSAAKMAAKSARARRSEEHSE